MLRDPRSVASGCSGLVVGAHINLRGRVVRLLAASETLRASWVADISSASNYCNAIKSFPPMAPAQGGGGAPPPLPSAKLPANALAPTAGGGYGSVLRPTDDRAKKDKDDIYASAH